MEKKGQSRRIDVEKEVHSIPEFDTSSISLPSSTSSSFWAAETAQFTPGRRRKPFHFLFILSQSGIDKAALTAAEPSIGP